MGWQCAVQMLGLVRGDGARRDGKGKAKHRANAAAVVNEAFLIADPEDGHPIPYRKSASETYDRARTSLNKYGDIKTADGVMQALEGEAAKQKIEVHTIDKTTGEPVIRYKGLQSNTPIGIAVIFNPPGEITRDWSKEKCAKFIADCEDCLAQIPCMKIDKKGQIKRDENGDPVEEPRYLFRKENLLAHAEHWDESEPGDPPVYSPNWHNIYIPADQYGKYNGSMVDAMFFSVVLNKKFPELMRERGWDIDDPEHTDWERFAEDKEYKSKRRAKIKKGGRSVNKYRADKKLEEAEAKLDEAAALVAQASELVEDAERREREADDRVREAEEAARKAKEEKAQAEDQTAEATRKRDAVFQEEQAIKMGLDLLTAMRANTMAEIKAATTQKEKLEAEIETVTGNLAAIKAAITDAERTRDTLRTETETARRDRDGATTAAEAARRGLEATKNQVKAEIETYRKDLIAQAKAAAKDAAKAEQARIEAAARTAWAAWLENKKQTAEETAGKILQHAKDEAADIRAAATGEHGFLIRYFGSEPFVARQGAYAGKSYLEIARIKYQAEIRKNRVKSMPSGVRDAGKSRQAGVDGPAGPGT